MSPVTGYSVNGSNAKFPKKDTLIYNVLDHGVLNDGKVITDGTIAAGSLSTLTSASAVFTSADVGKQVLVSGATTTAFRLHTTIQQVVSGTQITLALPAQLATTGQTMVIDGFSRATDAVTQANSTTVTSATAAFTAADVGRRVTITACATRALATTISGYNAPNSVTLATPATRAVSGVQVIYGTDNAAAMAALNAAVAAIPAAFTSAARRIYYPWGMYLCSSSTNGSGNAVLLGSNTIHSGDGWGTIIQAVGGDDGKPLSREMWGVNMGSGGTTNPAQNINNIVIENMHFRGTVQEEGFLENGPNLLSFNAVSHLTIRSVKFSNFRSDGIYIGSGTSSGTLERHNEHVIIELCVFDGVTGNNRNGISIVDCTNLKIDRNLFTTIANDQMPGAIDIEPNNPNAFARCTGIKITDNYFTQIGGNVGVIGWAISTPDSGLTRQCSGLTCTGNIFFDQVSSTLGFYLYQPNTMSDSVRPSDILIAHNTMLGTSNGMGLNYPLDVEGVRGVDFYDNLIDICDGSIIIGYNWMASDVRVRGNTLKGVSYNIGKAIELCQCIRFECDANTFENVSPSGGGIVLRLTNGATNGSTNGIRFTNNQIRQGATNSISTISNTVAGHTTVKNAIYVKGNVIPASGLGASPWGDFIEATNTYTVTAAALTVDASLLPPDGTIVINTGATAQTSLTIANATPGQVIRFQWVITAASQVYATAANMKFAGGAAWAKSTTAGWSDIVSFRYDGTSWLQVSQAVLGVR